MKRLAITVIHDAPVKDGKGVERHDAAVDHVAAALTAKGHKVTLFATPGEVTAFIDGLRATKPELVFNLVESFGDNVQMDVHVGALLELMNVPFTGADPGGLFMAQDKVLTKKLLQFHGVKYPQYLTFALDRIETGGNIKFPLFVKPARADSSLGITKASLVTDFKSLIERVAFVHDTFGGTALVEEYIDGREYYVSVIGHLTPRALALVEMDFSGLPPNEPPVASYDAKWNTRTRAYKGTKSVIATNITEELKSRVLAVAREAYLATQMRDYGRVDVRVTKGGDVYVIEVNPNPYLARDAELAMAAEHSGLPYEELLEQLVEMAWKRRRERRGQMTPSASTNKQDIKDAKDAKDAKEKEKLERAERREEKARAPEGVAVAPEVSVPDK
jgi:D-alanine-D-alanine ligase